MIRTFLSILCVFLFLTACRQAESPAPEEAIRAILPVALKNDPWLRTFADPQTIEPVLKITAT